MKNITLLSVILLLLLLGNSCQTSMQKNGNETAENQEMTISADDEAIDELIDDNSTLDVFREPTDEEIREFGIVQGVEDSGYPRYIVTIEFPERNMSADFNLNVEAGVIDIQRLNDMVGQYATVYYTTDDEADLRDMKFEDKSVFGDEVYGDPSEWKQITGMLSGAEEVTPGDLPGEVTVTAADGTSVSFEWFVNPEMVEVNGQLVTAFYTFRPKTAITYLKASENEAGE